MGIANIIPGVSGGTIALITNIYEDLIFSLKANSFWKKFSKKLKNRHISIDAIIIFKNLTKNILLK